MRKPRILMLEDDIDILNANKLHLEKEGYEIIAVTTIKEAQNAIWEYPPDLILLDVMLPDGSGIDFCKIIRNITSAPIIFLTCMDTTDFIVDGFSYGADDYITKPYNMDILTARVAAQLRHTENSRNGFIDLPPLYINLITSKVRMGAKDISLSSKEIRLLAFFAENIGREYTAEELYRTVWDETPTVSCNNTIRVHISNLRAKLNLDEASPFEICLTPSKSYAFVKTFYEAEE